MERQNEIFNEQIIENSEFVALLKHTGCGICAYKMETGKRPQMMYMTDGFCSICEASKEEIFSAYKRNRLFGVQEEHHEKVNEAIAKAVVTGKEQEVFYKAQSIKGAKKWCALKLNPDRRSTHTVMMFATFFDMTKQMKTQLNLSNLIHNIPGAVCLYHYKGAYLEPIIVSDRYSEMLGTDAYLTLSQMRDMNFRHVHPEDLEKVKAKVMEALTKTYQLNHTYRSYNEKTGKYLWMNVQGKVIPQEDGSSYSYVIYTDITKDKEIEQKLRANEQILEAATKNAGVWYWNCHWRQNVAYMGERFQNDFSLPAKLHDFCGAMIACGIIDEMSQDAFKKMCKNIMSGEKEAESVVRGYFSDGTAHWMKFKLSNIFDEKGIPQEAVGIMHLVDDVKEMERKYEIEKRHAIEDKDLLAHCCINVSSWEIVDYDGVYLHEFQSIPFSVEQLGKAIIEEVADYDIKEQIQKLHDRKCLLNWFAEGKTETSLEYQRTLKNGKCIWVRSAYHLMRAQNGNDLLLFEYCYNINMKKTMNILTQFAVNDDYDLMGFVNMQDKKTIMIYGKNSYNPHHADILEDDYTDSLLDFAANAVVKEDRERYLELANIESVGNYLKTHDNLEFYFNVKNEKGQIQAKKVRYMKYKQDDNSIIFIQSDITQLIEEQKKNQEALELALENAKVASNAKTSFLSQMSHEIRTPMNAIIGMAKLAEQTEEKAEVARYLAQINDSSQYLLGILNDILDMSKIESGKLELHPQWTDGCKIIRDCIQMLKPAMEKKKLHFIYPKLLNNSKLCFWVDPLRVQQIYMNLLNNAIKFTPEGGTIELTFENIYHDSHYGRDRIQIKDTGCGMSEDFLKRIFHPFEMEENEFSSKVPGTGLGLALVKSFITKMGGKIWVESKLGCGSTFTFEFPYEAKLVEMEEEDTQGDKKVSLEGKRILLADDHPLNREIAKKLLEHEKAEVVTAVDGEDACRQFARAENDYFDAILMDIRMPNMDGLEATRKIRAMDKKAAADIPIIAMTANAFDEDAQRSMDAGMNVHLAKPIEPDKLLETLEWYIGCKNQ